MKASRASSVIVDTGPLVAVLDRADEHHKWCAAVFGGLALPLLTTEPVITEAFWHLRTSPAALDGLCEMIESGDLILHPMENPAAACRYAKRYKGDLADASVVHLSERFPRSDVFTVTVASGTATASAGFFDAADVGRLLKLDSGEEYYITAFSSATSVSVTGPDATASEATVWYVNDIALETESKRTNAYRTSSGDNGSTWNAVNAEWTHKRTFLFSTEVGAVTYREVGWSWGAPF